MARLAGSTSSAWPVFPLILAVLVVLGVLEYVGTIDVIAGFPPG